MTSAFYFFGGLADIFLSLMIWFILDSDKLPTIFVNGNRVYSVGEVIKLRYSGINVSCEPEEEPDQNNSHTSRQSSFRTSEVSRRMIE